MSDLLSRIRRAIARRPVRVAETITVIVAAAGVTLAPEVEDALPAIVTALAAVLTGEAAQTRTRPTADEESPR